jgi:hypothetical protein
MLLPSQRRPLSEIHAYVDRALAEAQADVVYRDATLPTVPFLPQRYVFSNDLSVIVRSLTKQEDHLFYAIIKAAADSGRGYGVDEHPTLDMFRFRRLMKSYTVVFEDESNGLVSDCETARKQRGRLEKNRSDVGTGTGFDIESAATAVHRFNVFETPIALASLTFFRAGRQIRDECDFCSLHAVN